MGAWGCRIDECDEFLETEECFYREFNSGKPVRIIIKEIKEKFLTDENPARHIAQLALYHCLICVNYNGDNWKQEFDFNKIRKADEKYWKILCDDQRLIKLRKEALSQFINDLDKVNSTMLPIKKQFVYSKGDCFWYKSNKKIFGAVVLEYLKGHDIFFIAISEDVRCDDKSISLSKVLDSGLYTAAWFSAEELMQSKKIHMLGKVHVEKEYINKYGLKIDSSSKFQCTNYGQTATWRHGFRAFSIPDITLCDFIKQY